jgi:Flp pilus assembly pilin Flp
VILGRLLRDERGVTLVEYAMVMTLFAVFAIVGFRVVATNANSQYTSSTNSMTSIQENTLPAVSP